MFNLLVYFYPRSPCGERQTIATEISGCNHFYPRSPCGERPQKHINSRANHIISIHALLAESDPYVIRYTVNFHAISIHALLAESDNLRQNRHQKKHISIHALLAESDHAEPAEQAQNLNFYPRSPCGERRKIRPVAPDISSISIHALLAESDPKRPKHQTQTQQFLSTLSLRRATISVNEIAYQRQIFLSTLSLRRATPSENVKSSP